MMITLRAAEYLYCTTSESPVCACFRLPSYIGYLCNITLVAKYGVEQQLICLTGEIWWSGYELGYIQYIMSIFFCSPHINLFEKLYFLTWQILSLFNASNRGTAKTYRRSLSTGSCWTLKWICRMLRKKKYCHLRHSLEVLWLHTEPHFRPKSWPFANSSPL